MGQARQSVERATRVIVDLRAVSHNVAEIRKKIGNERSLMAMVKANGYGHGAVEVSQAALSSGADSLGVAFPEEGQQLREAGIEAPILVIGLIQPKEAYKVVEFRLSQAVASIELLEALDCEAGKASTKVNVHVKVDTGMGRIGLNPEDAVGFIRKVMGFKNLNLEGIFSHFSSADERDKTFSMGQLQLFEQVISNLRLAGIEVPKKHMANSAAVLDLPQSYYDMVRPGLMIYGLYPSREVSRSIELRPAMTFKTRISQVKVVPRGTPISYGRTFVTRKKTTVVTLPVGYGDGYNRLLSNRGEVLIKGRRAPVIGTVCMDMCMVDASNVEDVQPGDEVILFGGDLPVEEIAAKIGTIVNEVVCVVNKRVPRIYIQ
ncbi:MAG: alanine racemase [Dehalococcoidales bacterium]